MVLLKSGRVIATAVVRRAFVKWWVLPYLHHHFSDEHLVDFKLSISEEIAHTSPRWIARDNVLIETWQMIRAVKQGRCRPLDFGDSYRRLK